MTEPLSTPDGIRAEAELLIRLALAAWHEGPKLIQPEPEEEAPDDH